MRSKRKKLVMFLMIFLLGTKCADLRAEEYVSGNRVEIETENETETNTEENTEENTETNTEENTETNTEENTEENLETGTDAEDEKTAKTYIEYEFDNNDAAYAIREQTIHALSIEAGDRKSVRMNRDSKKKISVEKLVYLESGDLVDSKETVCTFKNFKVESWKSSNTKVIKIDKLQADTYPVIAAAGTGTATITIVYSYSYEGEKAYYKTSATVNVLEKNRDIGLKPTTIVRGTSVTLKPVLKARTYTYTDENGIEVTETKKPEIVSWTSSAPAKITVDQGKVTGIIQGSAIITLRYKYAFSDGTLACFDHVTVTSNCFTVKGQKIYIQPSVANDADASPAINTACVYARDHATDAKPYKIILKKGTYKLATAAVRLYSNMTLDMRDGAVLKFAGVGGRDKSTQVLKLGISGPYDGETNYNASAKCAGYNGFRNVKILGGIIESTDFNKSTHVIMAHAKNVVLDGVTFTGGASMHMMEVAAIDGFKLKNCVFKNFKGSKAISADSRTGRVAYSYRPGNYEALQFDIAASDDCFGGIYMDGTPMKNVTITGCTFDGVPRGVGIHSQLLGSYHEKVNISGNTFRNTLKEAILLLGFRNCTINNNEIIGCGAGITMQSISNNRRYVLTKVFEGSKDYNGKVMYDVNSEIKGNKISIVNRGCAIEQAAIYVYGANLLSDVTSKRPSTGTIWGIIPKNNYYISNVRVEDNTITTSGWGIYFSDAKNCVAKNNKITGANFPANKVVYNGIYAATYSSLNEISGNVITSMRGNGISVSALSTVTGKIQNNTINKVAYCAIKVDNVTNPLTIRNNTFSSNSKTSNVVNINTKKTNKNCITLYKNKISGVLGTQGAGVSVESGTCKIKKNNIDNVNVGIYSVKENSTYAQSGNVFGKNVKIKTKIE